MEQPSISPQLQHMVAASSEVPGRSPQLNPQDSAPLFSLNNSGTGHGFDARTANSAPSTTGQKSFWSSWISRAGRRFSPAKITQHTQQDSPSRYSQWSSEWITDWWGLELVCWVIAALSLAAIVIALEVHKNQPVPEWGLGITLNSLISIFAAIGQMAMMKPVVECISQLKWLWFIRKEKLAGIQAFDDASRGPTGSLILFGKLRGRHLVSLGAAITIVSVAFGPFAQQVVSYPLRLHPVGTASAQQVFNYTGAGDFSQLSSPAIIGSFLGGISPSNSTSLSSVTPICSTGNCTWPPYASLAVCGNVVDLSSKIINNTCNLTAFAEIFQVAGVTNPGYPCFNYTLPEPAFIDQGADGLLGVANASLSNNAGSDGYGIDYLQAMTITSSLSNSSSLLSSLVIYQPDFLTSINSSLPNPVAYGLNLDFCIQTYNTTVSDGVVNTAVLSSQILQTNIQELYAVNNDSDGFFGNSSSVSVKGDTFGFYDIAVDQFKSGIQNYLDGDCYQYLPPILSLPTNQLPPSFCETSPGSQLFQVILQSTDLLSNITHMWDNLAISITNTFRTGNGDTGADGDTALGVVLGTSFAPVAFVETQYFWLLLPIGLVALTLVFLLATILKSQRLGSRVWKSSNLATLQGLHIDLHNRLGGLSSITEMEEKIKRVEVRFDMKGGKAEHGVEYRLVESKQEPYWRG